jgi:hypothetical protein
VSVNNNLIEPLRKYTIYGLLITMIAYASYFIHDYMSYPKLAAPILCVRAAVVLLVLVLLHLAKKVKMQKLPMIIKTAVFMSALGISVICMITQEGLSTKYFAEIIQIIMISALMIQLAFKEYLALLILVSLQYFVLMSFLSFNVNVLIWNAFPIATSSVIALFIHHIINKLLAENRALQGLLPICIKCKKIRNDKGYWEKMELYFSLNTTTVFSHGLCPDCLQKHMDNRDITGDLKY